ncbi:MAG: hypothetical protein RR774_06985, partial [Acinetobacter sp.]
DPYGSTDLLLPFGNSPVIKQPQKEKHLFLRAHNCKLRSKNGQHCKIKQVLTISTVLLLFRCFKHTNK